MTEARGFPRLLSVYTLLPDTLVIYAIHRESLLPDTLVIYAIHRESPCRLEEQLRAGKGILKVAHEVGVGGCDAPFRRRGRVTPHR